MTINYNDRVFRTIVNAETGEVTADTLFHYRQEGEVVWATYFGGGVKLGTLLARLLPDNSLDMRYQHINSRGEFMAGVCRSIPEILPDGRLRLHESWTWTTGDLSSGTSVVEQLES